MLNELYNNYFNDDNKIKILYEYDKKLKMILLEVLTEIEEIVKLSFIKNFINRYDDNINSLYNLSNFSQNKNTSETFEILKKQLDNYTISKTAINYYLDKYNYIPLKAYINTISFGLIKDLINISKENDKDHIYKNISRINLGSNKMNTLLELLVDTRNICCHNEILFSYENEQIKIPDLDFYNYQYKKNNLLAILLSIKVFINKKSYNSLIKRVYKHISKYSKKLNISMDNLLKISNLPKNMNELLWCNK